MPAEAADRLQTILAAAPRAATRGRRAAGPRFASVAAEWLEHGQRKRGLKHSTLKDYRYLINTHLLPAFGELEIRPITRGHIERWHASPSRSDLGAASCSRCAGATSTSPAKPSARGHRADTRHEGDHESWLDAWLAVAIYVEPDVRGRRSR